jgi:hypothetical protein
MVRGLLIMEVSRSLSDTPQSVRLLWKSDQPDAKDLYLRIHNAHNRQTSMPPAVFEPAIPASKRPQNHALEHAATGIGWEYNVPKYEFRLTELQNTIIVIITIIII